MSIAGVFFGISRRTYVLIEQWVLLDFLCASL